MDTSWPPNPEHGESCLEKYGEKALTKNGSGPYVTPLGPISSYASSSSFGNFFCIYYFVSTVAYHYVY